MTQQTLAKRLYNHKRTAVQLNGKSARPVLRWILKHYDDVEIVLLEKVDSLSKMRDGEIEWIAKLNTFVGADAGGLNATLGGDGSNGHTVSDATKRLRAELASNPDHPCHSTESRAKRSVSLMGHAVSKKSYDTMKKLAPTRNPGHYRWHVSRGIKSDTCVKCQEQP